MISFLLELMGTLVLIAVSALAGAMFLSYCLIRGTKDYGAILLHTDSKNKVQVLTPDEFRYEIKEK